MSTVDFLTFHLNHLGQKEQTFVYIFAFTHSLFFFFIVFIVYTESFTSC